jgi:pyruvate/2-oxoglutarate dehydrogenase complex dihydrolipoamide dehydrogenase (E3) component
MPQPEIFDVVILGSGQGGKRLAWHLAEAGKKVAVVERRWVGGSCPAVACLPSKNEVWSARIAHLVREAGHFGTVAEGVRTDMARVRLRKQKMVDREIELHLDRYRRAGAELIMGVGRFIGAKTIAVTLEEGGARVVAADEIVIDVGTHAATSDIPGLREARPMTHIEALELDRVPPHLIVLGGGYVGVEFAQAYRRFGGRVTIIETGPRFLPREDPDIAQEIREILVDEGVEVFLGARSTRVAGQNGEYVAVTVQTEAGERKVEGTHLLVAVGRVANTGDLGLEKAGVELDGRGFIFVDERLRTTAAGVWAIGECAGSPQFTHVSVDDFRIVRDNMAGGNRRADDRLIPHVMFTDPPLAHVGLTEEEARRRGVPVRVAKLPMRAVLRTLATDETRGFLKVLVGAADDRILGFTMIGSEAGEVMATVQTAMLAELPYPRLRDAVIAHLTVAEGLGLLLDGVPARPRPT